MTGPDFTQLGRTWTCPRRPTDTDDDYGVRAAMFGWYVEYCLACRTEPDDAFFLDGSDHAVHDARKLNHIARELGGAIARSYDDTAMAALTGPEDDWREEDDDGN